MRMKKPAAGLALLAALAALPALPALARMQMQPAKAQRLHGVIEKVDGHVVTARSDKGAPLRLNLAGNAMVVAVVKGSMADIKPGSFIGSGAIPQPDGTQKAVEVHIFPASMRGTGEGFRPWPGAPHGSMTNGTVGATVTGVNGDVLTVKYKGGEQKIVVTPGVPIVRYEIAGIGALKPGAAFSVFAAVKRPDGSFAVKRINVGRDGVVPH